jgi:DNA gyrase subunit B
VNSEFRDFAAPATFAVAHRFVEHSIGDLADARKTLPELSSNGYELAEVESRADDTFRLKVIERATSAASHIDVPEALFASSSYESLRKAYEKAANVVGLPPHTVTFGKKSRKVETFEELRSATIELAKEGIQVARFKGLGEMNPSELWDTTMDPARRMLMRVEVEDAATADRIFSMLMGDQVEPRREFIEQNAQDVRFLDV